MIRAKFFNYRTVGTVLVIIVSGTLLFFSVGATMRMRAGYEEALVARDYVVREENSLIAREKELSEDMVRIQTEEGIEAELRKRYGVMRAGETEIIIVDPKEQDGYTLQKRSFWESVKSIFTKEN